MDHPGESSHRGPPIRERQEIRVREGGVKTNAEVTPGRGHYLPALRKTEGNQESKNADVF